MHQDEIIKQLQEQNKQLKLENELLKARASEIEPLKAKIRELEARLAQYENAHTPPSLRRGRNRKKDRDTNSETHMSTLLMQEGWKPDIIAKPLIALIWAVKAVRRLGA